MTTRLARNALLSLGANLAARAASPLLFLLIARVAGPTDAGLFSLGTTYLSVFAAVLWGLDELTVREVARDPAATGRYFTHMLALRVVLSTATVIALYAVVRAAGYTQRAVEFLSLIGLALVADGIGAALQALFVAHRRLGVPFAAGLVALAVRLGGGAWALYSGAGWGGVAWAWIAGGVASAGLSLVMALTRLRPARVALLPLAWSWWARVARLAAPFTAISIITILEWQFDVLWLSVVRGEREVGWYSAAVTVFLALWMVSQAFRVALFPEMARLQAGAPAQLEPLYARSMRLMLASVLPMVAGLELLAPRIVALLYKGDFGPSVPALCALGWALVPLFLNVPGVRLLMVRERQGWLAWFVAASLATNVAANLLLAPALGGLGSGIARVLSSTVFFALQWVAVARYTPGFNLLRAAWRPALATAGMAASVWLMRGAPLGLVIAAGVVTYGMLAGWLVLLPNERRVVALRVVAWLRAVS